jgi:preprotein translocase subunit SecE
MSKIINNVKSAFRGIIWPKPKTILNDTAFTIFTTIALSVIIWLWVTGIDILVNIFLALF